MRVTRSEPLRIGGHQGHELMIEAKEEKSNSDVTAVQWLRFGSTGYLHMFGLARKEAWAGVFPRMRAVRDSIESK